LNAAGRGGFFKRARMRKRTPWRALVLVTVLSSPCLAQQPPSRPAAAAPPAAGALPPAEARIAPYKWDVDRVRCSDLLRAADDDRAAAAMFYYGYLAAKASIHIIDVSRISDNIGKVMQLCKAQPTLTVPQAFRQALGSHR
jgi:hypothetical protein